MSYLPERDKTFRLQACTPYFQANRIWVPQNRDWVKQLVDEVVAFPKAPNDDLVDCTSQAILWMRDNNLIDNNGYSNRWDEEDYYPVKKATYWSSLTNQRN